MGEFGFIDMLRGAFESIGDKAIVGIGDDGAVIPVSGDEAFVITTDMLNEEVHFLREATSARELGAKSLAVNLSDIAAMGARPVASFLSLALPRACRGEWAAEFAEGYREVSARYGVKLAGGDTTASKNGVIINVGVIGRAKRGRLKYRSGARPGDIVVVNGMLGESAAGLGDILDARLDTERAAIHRNPVPQVEEGIWLGGRKEVHSMIDLSDGLASDLRHILNASKAAAEIDIASIPTLVPLKLAVEGGEDYKLLFTVAPKSFDRLRADYFKRFGTELYPLGTITHPSVKTDGNETKEFSSHRGLKPSELSVNIASGTIVWTEEGAPVEKNWQGFTHF